jgi:putative zinc finger protein
MEDENLRAALAPGEHCLSLELIARYADGTLTGEERAAADAHIRSCLNCQAELALLRAVTSSRVPRTVSVSTAAAIVLLAIAAGGSYLLLTRRAPDFPTHVSTGGEFTRSLSVRLREPTGQQKEVPTRFEWFAVDGAVRYHMRLMAVDREELWSASTAALAVELPPQVRESIAAGRTLLWSVTAYNAAGSPLAESGLQSFRVLPK